ncbi:MAG: hypothetical protein FWF88_05120 [Peptococcaceae bacterium]|nr:hypothetical protein [Peptococcaceae bacterium]
MKKHKKIATFVFVTLLMMSVFGASPVYAIYQDQDFGSQQFLLRNVGSTEANQYSMMLNVFASPGQAQLWASFTVSRDDGTMEQRFGHDKVSYQKYYITSKSNNKGLCLDVYGDAPLIKTTMNNNLNNNSIKFNTHVWSKSSSGTNHWYLDFNENTGYTVIRSALNSNFCLTADSTAHRSSVSVKRYVNSDLQHWEAFRGGY